MIVQFAVALAATLSFAILFAAPPNRYALCALGGGLCWLINLSIAGTGVGAAFSCFSATLALMLFSRLVGFLSKTPVIVFVTTGIFPLVPGAAIYQTAYHFFLGDFAAGARWGADALITAGAITLGMLFGYALPQGLFQAVGRGLQNGWARLRPKA